MFEKKIRPEKVIQFGEGGFLRGFVDWMIQICNEKTDFDGEVVVVQPIAKGMCDILAETDCNYTHVCQGLEGVEGRPKLPPVPPPRVMPPPPTRLPPEGRL